MGGVCEDYAGESRIISGSAGAEGRRLQFSGNQNGEGACRKSVDVLALDERAQMKLKTDQPRRLSKYIQVCIDADMFAAMKAEAEMYNMSVSEFGRACIRTWLEGEQETETFRSGRAKGKKR